MNTSTVRFYHRPAAPAQLRNVHRDHDREHRRLVQEIRHAEQDGAHVGAGLLAVCDLATIAAAAHEAHGLTDEAAEAIDRRLMLLADILAGFLPGVL